MATPAIVLDPKSVPEPSALLPSMGLNLGFSKLPTQSSDVLESVLKSLQCQLELIDIQEKHIKEEHKNLQNINQA